MLEFNMGTQAAEMTATTFKADLLENARLIPEQQFCKPVALSDALTPRICYPDSELCTLL
jgi:hypothetical protein